MRTLGIAIACLLFCAQAARAGEAEDKAHVKKLYESATKHYNLSEFKEALDQYKEAYRIRPDPVFLFNIGQCYRQLNQPAEAARQYRAFLREQPDAKNRVAVEKLIKDMDDAVREQRAQLPPTGTEPPQQPTTTPAVTETVTVPVPDQEPPPRKPDFIAISLLVAGGVLVATGIGLMAWSSSLEGDALDVTTHTDLADRESKWSQSGTVLISGGVVLGVGAALAIASIVKFVVKPKQKEVSVGFAPGRLVLGGTF